MYIYIALLTFAGAFCERSCVVLLHLLLLFKLTPFSFFHYDALHAQCSIAATKQYDYHERFFVRRYYQAIRCSAPCCHVLTTNYDVINHANNQLPFYTQKLV